MSLNPQLFGIGIPGMDGTNIIYTLYTNIPQPQSVIHTPPPMIGRDAWGAPIVRGYGTMEWDYTTLSLSDWYTLSALWKQSRDNTVAWGQVQIQWPDPSTGTTQKATARWEVPTMGWQEVHAFKQVALMFTHLGYNDTTATGFWLPPVDNGAPGR